LHVGKFNEKLNFAKSIQITLHAWNTRTLHGVLQAGGNGMQLLILIRFAQLQI
jgi:hypothetical protein